jgi:hypothetical protein
MIASCYLATAGIAASLLRTDRLAVHWNDDSALREFRICGLAGHLAPAVCNVERFLDARAPDSATSGLPGLIDAVQYYVLTGDPEADVNDPTWRHVRDRGEQAAGTGAIDLADRFDAARERLATRLPSLDEGQPVVVFDQWVLSLRECLITRLVELVVHIDDLAVASTSRRHPFPTTPWTWSSARSRASRPRAVERCASSERCHGRNGHRT